MYFGCMCTVHLKDFGWLVATRRTCTVYMLYHPIYMAGRKPPALVCGVRLLSGNSNTNTHYIYIHCDRVHQHTKRLLQPTHTHKGRPHVQIPPPLHISKYRTATFNAPSSRAVCTNEQRAVAHAHVKSWQFTLVHVHTHTHRYTQARVRASAHAHGHRASHGERSHVWVVWAGCMECATSACALGYHSKCTHRQRVQHAKTDGRVCIIR